MIVLDTIKSPEYRGHIGKAYDMLLNNECDEVITRGADFHCIRIDDETLGKKVREHSLRVLKNATLRYIIVYNDGNDHRECLNDALEMTKDFKHARYFFEKDYAERILDLQKEKLISQGYSEEHLGVEEYLYHIVAHCALRIYYEITGLYTDKGFLKWVRYCINKNMLYPRYDQKGRPYILLDDLCPFKDETVTFRNNKNVVYRRPIDLKLLLHDGLIAFDEISNFVKAHSEYDFPEIAHLSGKEDLPRPRKFYDLGTVFYSDPDMQKLLCEHFHLDNWLPDNQVADENKQA